MSFPENSSANIDPLSTVGLSNHELEIRKHLDKITDLKAAGAYDLAEAYAAKFKSILNPDVPVNTELWLARFITSNSEMERVKKQVSLLSKHPDTVLIEGPTGTGKELLVRALHGDKKDTLFVDVNCAAIPEHLIESELFGHVKGSFTGADRDKTGLMVTAQTLFLDEIGELPLSMQAKLLRVIQERKVRPVGGSVSVPVTCRIVCATLRNLEKLVEEHLFREDLFYRLNTFHLRLTPLRDRPEDIQPITLAYARGLEEQHKKNPGDTHIFKWPEEIELKASMLPGNVRSIQQIVRRYQVYGERISSYQNILE